MIKTKIKSRKKTKLLSVVFVSVLGLGISLLAPLALSVATASASSPDSVAVWWPSDGAHVTGTQPLKAMVPGLDVSQYEMFWQVDGGTWNWMDNNYDGYQHKEVSVNVGGWSWHGSGPYTVNFIARQNGTVIAQQTVNIYIDNGLPASSASTVAVVAGVPVVSVTPIAVASSTNITNILPTPAALGGILYVNPNSSAAAQATSWAGNNPSGASAMRTLAAQPTAAWFGDWNSNIKGDVHSLVSSAAVSGTVPVLVAYNIPERDCGGYSSGGTNNPAGYANWIGAFAEGLGNNKAIIILEPDSLAQMGCLSVSDQTTRMQLLANAVTTLKKDANAKVYLDAGHSGWVDAGAMAQKLLQANIAGADGFSLNVSNYSATSNEVAYGQDISSRTGGKHFVIDTGRNGNGSNGDWCNASGRAIGAKPTLQTGNPIIDGYLWIKTPGESDGTCNGGPNAGQWWPDYALGLVQNAHN